MNFNSLSDWSQDFLKQHPEKIAYSKIFSLWKDIVGEKIAKISNPSFFKDNTLFVEVKEQSWQIELGYHRGTIIKKYQEKIPLAQVKHIHFKYNPHLKISPSSFSTPKNQHDRKKSPNLEDQNNLEPLVSDNVDERIAILIKTMKKHASTPRIMNDEKHPTMESKLNQRNLKELPKKPIRRGEIDRYYPFLGMYSDFFSSPDPLQNFDLY